MQPVRALASDATRLLIAPDGALNLIPFEALVDDRGRFLVEGYAISYLTSGRDLRRLRVARESKGAPLVVADPVFGEPPSPGQVLRSGTGTTGDALASVYFARLPGTAQEANGIRALFPDAKLLTRQQASKAALSRVDAPSILHIATHAFFLQDEAVDRAAPLAADTRAIDASVRIENPLLRSGLALAGANLKDRQAGAGILTALEASNLNL
jgi:CHAT domain-containing protein